jgi:hypothetical protein
MYKGKGNTKGYTERRRAQPQPERQAQFIAESITARRAEGRTYTVTEYGIDDHPEMIEHVARALGVIR